MISQNRPQLSYSLRAETNIRNATNEPCLNEIFEYSFVLMTKHLIKFKTQNRVENIFLFKSHI